MWIEEKHNKKGLPVYHYYERYKDRQGKTRKVCITLNSNSKIAHNTASRLLYDKIATAKTKSAKMDDIKHSIGAIANEWIEYSKHTVKYRTHLNHKMKMKKLFTYLDPNMRIDKITVNDIYGMIECFYHEQDLCYAYVNSLLGYMKLLFKHAKKRQYIQDISDFLDIKIKKKPFTLKDLELKENKFLERDELKSVLTQLTAIDKRIALAMEFMSLTGLRIGELLALRECDYNKTDKTIHITGTLINHLKNGDSRKRDTPKNIYSVRYVTLDNRATAIIDRFIAENKVMQWNCQSYKNRGYIFTAKRGYPYNAQYINKALRKVKIEGKSITSHIFRHTHISLLCELGIPLKAIMSRVGHNDPNTTLGIYSHVTKASQNDIIDKLNKIG